MDRSASATLDGFRWQIIVSAQRFVHLEDDHLLVLEASEDITTTYRPTGSRQLRVVDEQLKLHSTPVSARSPSVYRSIFNFLFAFATEHHPKGQSPNYRFLTSASKAGQQTDQDIPHDVLSDWHILDSQILRVCIKGLVLKYGQKWKKTNSDTTAHDGQEELLQACYYLDKKDVWASFQESVTWMLKLEGPASSRDDLASSLRQDPRLQPNFSAEVLADLLICHCLNVACQSDIKDRCLTRDGFRRWATRTQFQLLSDERHLLAMQPKFSSMHDVVVVEDSLSRFMTVAQILSPALASEFSSLKEALNSGAFRNMSIETLKTLPLQDQVKLHEWVEKADYVAYVLIRTEGSNSGKNGERFSSSIFWSVLAPYRNTDHRVRIFLDGVAFKKWRGAIHLYAKMIGVTVDVSAISDQDAMAIMASYIGVRTSGRVQVETDPLRDLYDSLRHKVRFVVVEKSDGTREHYHEGRRPLP